MTVASPLNMDMATLGRLLGSGLKWWLTELAGLLPARLARRAIRNVPIARLDKKALLQVAMPDGRDLPLVGAGVRNADLAVDAQDGLVRELVLPAMSLSDLRDYVDLERDRLLPLPGVVLLHDAEIVGPTGESQQRVRIGAVRREQVLQLVDKAVEAGLMPQRIGLMDHGALETPHFDFSRSLRAEGRLPRQGTQRQYWWAIVAALFLLNVGLLIWRDQQSVDHLQALVDEQQPAVAVYRAIAGRITRTETVARSSTERRKAHRPLVDLAATTAALPPTAWVQRYGWTGWTIQLAGYAHGGADVAAALRRSPRFADVRATNGDVQADIPMGRPFDVTIDLRDAKR